MLKGRSWLDAKATRTLIAALDAGGIDFRFVGGAVRDGLLGRKVSDIDVATPAMPEGVVRAVEAAGLKAIPTGLAHGTVTVMVGRQPFEVTTLRRDVETDGRHAVVAFTDDWRADAARRDFTMNALYADRDGAITDFFGGEADARAGHIRFIGEAVQRIAEDALRILRFFRFHAWYGRGALDADGLAASAKLAGMIERLSGERIRVELLKTLAAPDPAPAWAAMIEAGVMAHTLHAAVNLAGLSRMVALERELGLPADPLRRLAALTGAPSTELLGALKDRLKLSNRDEAHLRLIGGYTDRIGLVARRKFGRALYGAEPAWLRDAAMQADIETGTLAGLIRFIEGWTEPKFPLTGADLKAVGIEAGPGMGRTLAELERWWIEADFAPDKEACLARLRDR
ncbi:MAG TPA: CCA tRNA nucleotidyltransferase [Alphaproteobacteria bacterium]|nr:CCA tRNA nucleotidyltransferase [Alphaproteobacteria bacterium]